MTMRGIPTAAVVAMALASVIVLAGASTACDGDSPRRTPTQPDGTVTTSPTVTRLELSGPGTVNLGESVQFTALAHMSDGSFVCAAPVS